MNQQILDNRYKLESEIGRGGMGVVYRAEDTQVKRTVAIKTLPAVMTHNQELMKRFNSEVQNASKLEHQNIARVFDVGEDGGTHYYVMQYIDGSDLRAEMKKRGRFNVDETIRIISQVAGALDYAYSQGIVHRDIKPENILLDKEGNTHVVDFGISKATEGTRTTRGMLGTPEYMSPEQVKGKSVDGRSDQYSLATMAYEMLTGRTPFKTEGDDPWAQINMHLNIPVPNPRTIVPDLPNHIANTLLQALAKKPEQRFGSCGEFVQALRGEIESMVPEATVESRATCRKWKTSTALVGCLVLAIAALVWLPNRRVRDGGGRPGLSSPRVSMVNQIAFVSTVDGVSRIMALIPGKNEKTSIGLPFKSNGYRGLWDDVRISQDGGTLLLVSGRDVYIHNPDGLQKKIASEAKVELGGVSPDGSLAVFCDGNIQVVETATLRKTALTRSGIARTPSFSPDGKSILYVDDRNIFSSDPHGSHSVKLTESKGDYSYPVSSADGSCIALVRDKSLCQLDMAGRIKVIIPYVSHTITQWRIVNNRTISYQVLCDRDSMGIPSYSPDGKKIAIIQSCGYDETLIIVDTRTGSQHRLQRDSQDETLSSIHNCTFSPIDGALLFGAKIGGSDLVSILKADLSTWKTYALCYGENGPFLVRRPVGEVAAVETAVSNERVIPKEVTGKTSNLSGDFDGDGDLETAGHGATNSQDGFAEEAVWLSKNSRIVWKSKSTEVSKFFSQELTGDSVPELIYTTKPQGSGGIWNCYVFSWDGKTMRSVLGNDGVFAGANFIVHTIGPGKVELLNVSSDSGGKWGPWKFKVEWYRWNGKCFAQSAMKKTIRTYETDQQTPAYKKALVELGIQVSGDKSYQCLGDSTQ